MTQWRSGDPLDECRNMHLAVMDEFGNIFGAAILGEHADSGEMTVWRDGATAPCDWQSSWLWMEVPTRRDHFAAVLAKVRAKVAQRAN